MCLIRYQIHAIRKLYEHVYFLKGFLVAQMVKNLPAMQEIRVQSLD